MTEIEKNTFVNLEKVTGLVKFRKNANGSRGIELIVDSNPVYLWYDTMREQDAKFDELKKLLNL